MNKRIAIGLITTLSLFFYGCATPERADLGTSDPKEAISTVYKSAVSLHRKHVDLLAPDDFKKGMNSLEEAQEDYSENDDTEEVLNQVAEAKAYFQKAERLAESRRNKVSKRIYEARSSAIETKVLATPDLAHKLSHIDEDLRDETDMFEKSLSVDEFSDFQNKYLELEVKAVQHKKLQALRNIVDRAKSNDANDLAPKTYKEARSDIRAAENLIKQNPRNEDAFKGAVLEANKSAKLLQDVMNKLKGPAKGSSEAVALQLVRQERKLGKLSGTVSNLEGELQSTQTELGQTAQTLKETRSEVMSKEQKLKFQQAMDSVRKNFKSDEAEVYQQGNRLIIRLKELNFKTGSASIPAESMDLLAKVDQIIEKMDPQSVTIQGHTDSTGPSDLNQQLSMKRARSVASYFSSKGTENFTITPQGYGESQPLANNETNTGRALNRRVDVVIDAK